jgi:hypothetical protein
MQGSGNKKAPTKAAGVQILKQSKKFQMNNSEAQRINRRTWKEKEAMKTMDFSCPEEPWATLLLDARVELKQLVERTQRYTGDNILKENHLRKCFYSQWKHIAF